MKVLMLSIDKGLLGQGALGDVISRHIAYGEKVEQLDILVFSRRGFSPSTLSPRVHAHPTNSFSKINYFFDGRKLGDQLFSKTDYDLIVTQDPFLCGAIGLYLKNKYKKKLLVHCHGDFFMNPQFTREKWYNTALIIFGTDVVRQANGIRVMSRGQKEKLLKMGIAEEKIKVISTPVDVERFALAQPVKQEKKIILMVGRKDPVKDFPTLFSALKKVFEKISDAQLMLVGNYTNPQDVPLPSDRLILKGVISTEDLPAIYAASDVVVLSSISESFGKVLIEANATGKPVVATATSGAQEIIQDGVNGFIVPIGDAEALATKIIEILETPGLAERMGKSGQQLVRQKYDGKKNLDQIIQLWKEIAHV